MRNTCLIALVLLAPAGCGHRYTLIGESDTDRPVAISIMKTRTDGEPSRLYYTELSKDGTRFIFDENVADSDGRVEAWFDLKQHPGNPTIYALPPQRRVKIKFDDKDGRVILKDIEFEGHDNPEHGH